MTASGASALQKGYISFEFEYCQAQVQEGQSQVRFSSETWLVGWYDSSMVRGGWDFKVDFKVVNKWTSGSISGNLKLLI